MTRARSAGWKKGRGKLGVLDPLLGEWMADADTPVGPVRRTRSFTRVLQGTYVLLEARWEFGEKVYQEHTLFGAGPDGKLMFWSFTSDGKNSQGRLADASDIHPDAIGFEAQMPAGLARQVYWPGEDGVVEWAVESRAKKGWNRFQQHRYRRRPAPPP